MPVSANLNTNTILLLIHLLRIYLIAYFRHFVPWNALHYAKKL